MPPPPGSNVTPGVRPPALRLTGEERLEEWVELNRAVARMEADGIRQRHPDYDDHQVLLAQARLRYGDELVRNAWPNDPLYDP